MDNPPQHGPEGICCYTEATAIHVRDPTRLATAKRPLSDDETRCAVVRIYPTHLRLASDQLLQIEWNDGQRREYTADELRDSCPCASCRQKTGHGGDPRDQPPAGSAEPTPPLTITGIKPVGNYAYAITFSDGHKTGIYTLEYLRMIGRVINN